MTRKLRGIRIQGERVGNVCRKVTLDEHLEGVIFATTFIDGGTVKKRLQGDDSTITFQGRISSRNPVM